MMYAADMMYVTFEMKLSEQNKYESANFDMCVTIPGFHTDNEYIIFP